ncbi:type II toxin-antitoxin system RelE family toxin [Spirulina major]|uniref:type II toxin-antitoxin system RelE family toxin n=1 Tax=Spirulina major TaxID=270636 RepID=UPI00093535B4|nr:type II toxin-antitoxin system RelE/ParE family toxin [Spirulina major]
MSINPNPINIDLSSRFKKDLKTLAKRYRSIRQDLQPLIAELQAGDTPGDQIQGLQHTVFKVRLKNSDTQKGKSGGYRVIYYLRSQIGITLITIYSKSDQSDVSNQVIEDIIRQYQN